MSTLRTESLACSCGKEYEVEIAVSVNVTEDPELLDKILDHDFNTIKCTCGKITIIEGTVLYIDMTRQLMVQSMITKPKPNFDFVASRKAFLEQINMAKEILHTENNRSIDTDQFQCMTAGNLYELGSLIRARNDDINPLIIQLFSRIIKFEVPCTTCNSNKRTAIYYLGLDDTKEYMIFFLHCLHCKENNIFHYNYPIQRYKENLTELNDIILSYDKIKDMFPQILDFENDDSVNV